MWTAPCWTILTVVLSCSLGLVESDDLCIPNRCDPAEFNPSRSQHSRATHEAITSEKPEMPDGVIKDTLSFFVRGNNDTAKLFKCDESNGGFVDKWIVTLFNYDKDGEFAKRYSKYIEKNLDLGDKDASIFILKVTEEEVLKELCGSPKVAYLEQLKKAKPLSSKCTRQVMFDFDREKWIASWGLTRLDQRNLKVDNYYNHDTINTTYEEDIIVYVVDSGVEGTRTDEFGTRLKPGLDFTHAYNARKDTDGHGTHVAGTAGGVVYGVAKNVQLVPVRVTTSVSEPFPIDILLDALSWIRHHALEFRKENKAVVNLSLGAAASLTINMVVNHLVQEGIVVVVAAGNEASDACCFSPASATGAITVGCSDNKDRWCANSNWGPCMDVIAPGRSVFSASNKGRESDPSQRTGTSMSTPHVSGAVAVLLGRSGGMAPEKVKRTLLETATTGKITEIPEPDITPNRLLYIKCES